MASNYLRQPAILKYRSANYYLFLLTVRPAQGNPAPTSYDIRPNHFKNDMEQGRGSSFGLGRSQMQKTDQERDINSLKNNPSPVKYEPVPVGKVMAKDAVKYSM